MQPSDVLEVLLALASEAGMRVQVAGRDARPGDALPPVASGICRVRGVWWVVLSSNEPAEAQIGTLARALKTHAGSLLEERHLPPAVRAVVDAAPGVTSP